MRAGSATESSAEPHLVRVRQVLQLRPDLWVVLDEGYRLDWDRSGALLPPPSERSILVKYTHTFR